jgi:hypothetical protein
VTPASSTSELLRFGNRCAYCLESLGGRIVESDHLKPRSRGGSDEASNRAPSCNRCNRAKGSSPSRVVDPHTGLLVAFFDPWDDQWDDHFLKRGGEILGCTPTGRASAAVLFRHLPSVGPVPDVTRLPIELHGSEGLALIGAQIQLIHDSIDQKGAGTSRSELEPQLLSFPLEEREELRFLEEWLYTQMRFRLGTTGAVCDNLSQTRVTPQLRSSDLLRRQRLIRLDWYGMTAIQAATVERALRRDARSLSCEAVAAKVYATLADVGGFGNSMHRWRSLAHRMAVEPARLPSVDRYLEEVLEAEQQNDFVLLGEIAEAIAKAAVHEREVEKVFGWVDRAMSTAGYRSGGDLAQSITLRRRWWLLHARLHHAVDLSLLRQDLSYWDRLSMTNEVRTLCMELSAAGVVGLADLSIDDRQLGLVGRRVRHEPGR